MKHIRKISIKGYRGFRSEDVVTLAVPDGRTASGLTVLTGPNNSGKTSVLETVRALGSKSQPVFGRPQRNSVTNEASIVYELADERKIELASTGVGTYTTYWNPQYPAGLSGKVLNIPAARDVAPFFTGANITRHDHSQLSVELKPVRNESVGLHRLLRTIVEDPKLKDRFDSEVSSLLGFRIRWGLDQLENQQFVFTISAPTGSHTSDGVGYGVLSVFHLVAGLLESSESHIVCIDEPEISLHPQVQRRVAAYLAQKSSDVQVIVSTHSPYFTDPAWFANGAELLRCYVAGDTTKLGRLSAETKQGILKVSSDLNNPHIFGLDAREIFFATGHRRVLVVEGQEDVVILSRLLEGMNIPSDFEMFGWGAGGAEKIGYIVRVLQDLGITDIAILVDGDKGKLGARLQAEFPGLRHAILPADDIRDKPARGASTGKSGVCTSSGELKPEYQDSMVRLLNQLAK